jgi:flotillin
LSVRYHVAEPNSYLVITGAGIDKVLIRKKALVYPFQKVTKISITPFDFSMNLQAMTVEKLKFALPAVFTIGPEDTAHSLEKYAVLLTGDADGSRPATNTSGAVAVAEGRGHVQDIVKGIIEGETRSIVSTMTMEELFRERKVFKDKVINSVQSELDQFGLRM